MDAMDTDKIWVYRVCYANVARDTNQDYAATSDSDT
jgi:hypothetical protein